MSRCLATMLFAGLLAQNAVAQTPMSGPLPTTSGMGFTGAPYSAKETTVDVKTATNGVKYSTTHVTLLWRDADGRTRQEHLEETPSGAEYRSVVVADPVAGVYLKWRVGADTAGKIAGVLPMTTQQRVTGPVAVKATPKVSSVPCGPGCMTEVLPPQQINGIDAQGVCTKHVIPVGTGEDGQEVRLTIINELWSAPDLAIIVRHVMDDPRTGVITTDVTDVVRGSPDPSLFRVPADYQAKDMPQPSPTPR